jgi:acyl transferase domain-containing protein
MLEHVYTIRAYDEDALSQRVGDAAAEALMAARTIGEGPAVAAFAAVDREGLERALAVVKKSGLQSSLDELRAKHGVFVRFQPPRAPEKIAVLFSGQGSQYPGMMRRLADEVPSSRQIVERVDRWLSAQNLTPLSPVLFSGQPIPNSVFVVQAAILTADLMCWVALSEALDEAGVQPEVVTGHSFGDYAALVAAEAWTIEDALFATLIRSQAIEETTESGGMMSVLAPLEQIAPVLRALKHVGHVQAANINAPDQIVIAGTPKALRAATDRFRKEGIEIVQLSSRFRARFTRASWRARASSSRNASTRSRSERRSGRTFPASRAVSRLIRRSSVARSSSSSRRPSTSSSRSNA